ncbi:CMRF35-like molecule 8 [Eudromia elegans]
MCRWLLHWLLLPGCWAVTGPHSVEGFVGGSLSVPCSYKSGLEKRDKFWCKPGRFYTCAGPYIIATSEHELFVRKDRISIEDNRPQRVFTVTLENLTEEDTGTYRCGVQRTLLNDRHTVTVNVSPVSRLWTTTTVTAHLLLAPQPPCPGTTVTPECCPTSCTPGTSPHIFHYFPVVAGLQLLALVAGSVAVLWVSARPC